MPSIPVNVADKKSVEAEKAERKRLKGLGYTEQSYEPTLDLGDYVGKFTGAKRTVHYEKDKTKGLIFSISVADDKTGKVNSVNVSEEQYDSIAINQTIRFSVLPNTSTNAKTKNVVKLQEIVVNVGKGKK